MPSELNLGFEESRSSSFLVCSIFLLWYDGIAIKKRVDVFEAKGVRMTRKYRLERTAFIGCRNTAYMDVDDAEPCPFCGSRQRAKLLNDIDDVCGDMDLIEGIELALEVNDPQGVHLSMSHDNGIDCAYIPINYCPICGRNFRKDR